MLGRVEDRGHDPQINSESTELFTASRRCPQSPLYLQPSVGQHSPKSSQGGGAELGQSAHTGLGVLRHAASFTREPAGSSDRSQHQEGELPHFNGANKSNLESEMVLTARSRGSLAPSARAQPLPSTQPTPDRTFLS